MSEALIERMVERIAALNARLTNMENRDPWTVGRVDYPNAIFAQMEINSGATGKYLRIASLPATGAGTGDSLVIEFFGGVVGSANQFRGVIRAGNNGGFNAYLERLSGDTTQLTHARVVAYTNSGVTSFYLRLPGTANAFVAARVDASGWGTKPTLYPGESESTSTPGGSLVFDSSTATVEYISCLAYSAIAQSIPNTTWTSVAFELEIHDRTPGGTAMHDLATNNSRIYARVPGLYRASAIGAFAANATGTRGFRIIIDGVVIVAMDYGSASSASQSIRSLSGEYLLAAGQYVELEQYQDTGGALNTYAWGGGQIVPSLTLTCINRNG